MSTRTKQSTKRRGIDNYCIISWADSQDFMAARVSGRICKYVTLQNVGSFFTSSKLRCASCDFSIHRPGLTFAFASTSCSATARMAAVGIFTRRFHDTFKWGKQVDHRAREKNRFSSLCSAYRQSMSYSQTVRAHPCALTEHHIRRIIHSLFVSVFQPVSRMRGDSRGRSCLFRSASRRSLLWSWFVGHHIMNDFER